MAGFARRIYILPISLSYDFILIHREASPIGPPIFEWLLAKIFQKKIIFDFDDAIWFENTSQSNKLATLIKFPQKVRMICSWSYKVSAGNTYLGQFASQYCNQVVVNPTTIDTEQLHKPQPYKNDKVVVGWTGTHSTLKYLNEIANVLNSLLAELDFEILIIADKKPEDLGFEHKFLPWNKLTEIEDLNQIDIGIMPLSNDKWSKGKCGFKALQYMALEKPVVASPVGVNTEIIENEITGFLCTNRNEWISALKALIANEALRKEIGKKGRKTVIERYSVLSNRQNFLSLFE